MLPAPKNVRPLVKQQPAPTKSADIVECAASSPQPKSDDRALIPHSLSNKRKSKSKPVSARLEVPKQQSGDTANPDANTIEIAQIDEPFFTFAADEPSDTAHCDEPDDYEQISEPAAIDRQTSGDLQAGLVYDPTSGYYYDTRSGVYYYFDPQSGSYIDAQTLYDSAAPASSTPHAGDAQAVDELEIEKLIGRGGMRRGEASIAGTIKTVSQTSQLADSGYSDVRAGAEFSAKRALAQQRQSTRRTIAGDEVSRQKKQKHNIMYLAHQAQEQEDTLRERHANRQQAKKAAKAKYGY
ncbi:hypothetical protein GGF43_001960 [Coemansia sp. RSA 2618]|nr:hypothetical protein GGF43_001960 [Coemansia sp. RSA 2618]